MATARELRTIAMRLPQPRAVRVAKATLLADDPTHNTGFPAVLVRVAALRVLVEQAWQCMARER